MSEKYYITSAIAYTNGEPHIGHAYEAIACDVIGRYHRIYGNDLRFQTGSDEHGQKIAASAEAKNMTPIELCNQYVDSFKKVYADCDIQYDTFLRTTDQKHIETSQWLFKKAEAAGDIYLGTYNGWYNVKEETFVTELEAKKNDYKDPASGQDLQKMTEESYFFKMSKYQDRLVAHIKENPTFIQPENRRQEILKRLEEPLLDLSCSRTTFSWGIPCPDDPKHVMYVWFDALTNYLTGLNYQNGGPETEYWPASVQIVGKDIIWFHTVIWPCMLMSTDIALPKTVFAHGFINDEFGKKMSKSIGNVIEPGPLMAKYGSDSVRLYLCRQGIFGQDFSFSEDALMTMHNADLANTLGNLVHRGVSLCKGVIPDVRPEAPFDLNELIKATAESYASFTLETAARLAIESTQEVNKYLTVNEPWKIKDDPERRDQIIRSTVEAIYVIAHFIYPFTPKGAESIFEKLQTPRTTIQKLSPTFENLTPGNSVNAQGILYPKILTSEEEKLARAKEAAKRAPPKKKPQQKASPIDPNQDPFTMIDLRVGQIVKAWVHPDADKLICEEIDVGEDEPRQIASGLRAHYDVADIKDKKVLVICNLRPVKMVGFKSCGMVLCAKDAEAGKVEFVEPPADAKVGERILCEGLSGEPLSGAQVKKRLAWENTAALLKSDENKVATYNGLPLMTSSGACTIPNIANAPLS